MLRRSSFIAFFAKVSHYWLKSCTKGSPHKCSHLHFLRMFHKIRKFQHPRALNNRLSNNRAGGGGLHEDICVHCSFSLFSLGKLPKSDHPLPHHRGAAGHQAAQPQGGRRGCNRLAQGGSEQGVGKPDYAKFYR